MTNAEFLASIPNDVANRDLLIDGEKFYMTIFLFNNLIPDDVDHISLEDAQRVIDLEVGKSLFLNLTEIKRIS